MLYVRPLRRLSPILAIIAATLVSMHSMPAVAMTSIAAADEPLTISDQVFHDDVSIEGEVTIERCLFEGRLYLSSWTTFSISNSILLDGIEVAGSAVDGKIINNTIIGSDGVGIELRSYRGISLRNNIVAFNRVGVSNHGRDRIDLFYSDVFGNREDFVNAHLAQGSMWFDPLFRNYEAGDYRLSPNSPCIDSGDPAILDADSSRSDIGALPQLGDNDLPSFSLLSPANDEVVTDSIITFSWERLRYARLYNLKMYVVIGEGHFVSTLDVNLQSPLNALTLNINDFDRSGESVFGIHWTVEAISLSDTIECHDNFFVRTSSLDVKDNSALLQPSSLILHPAFPNPFNSSTTISYTLPSPGWYALSVVDLTGREVARLSDRWQEAGSYRQVWDGKGVGSGRYFVRLSGRLSNSTRSVEVLR